MASLRGLYKGISRHHTRRIRGSRAVNERRNTTLHSAVSLSIVGSLEVMMRRRAFLETLGVFAAGIAIRPLPAWAAETSVSTLVGNGAPGFSEAQVNQPYGLVIGPDKALYFCDLENSRIRSLDLGTRRLTTVAGIGQKAYGGDGGSAVAAPLNMPHELRFDRDGNIDIPERDNHAVRKGAA